MTTWNGLRWVRTLWGGRSAAPRPRRTLLARLERRGIVLLAAASGLVVAMMLLYLGQANRLTTTGYEVFRLADERALLVRQNTQLRFEIARLTDLGHIQKRAEEMKLAAATDYRHLVVRTGLVEEAFPRSLLAPPAPLPQAPLQAASVEEFSGWWEEELHRFELWLEAGLAFGFDESGRGG